VWKVFHGLPLEFNADMAFLRKKWKPPVKMTNYVKGFCDMTLEFHSGHFLLIFVFWNTLNCCGSNSICNSSAAKMSNTNAGRSCTMQMCIEWLIQVLAWLLFEGKITNTFIVLVLPFWLPDVINTDFHCPMVLRFVFGQFFNFLLVTMPFLKSLVRC